MKTFFILLTAGSLSVATALAQTKPVTLIKAGHLVDVVAGTVLDDQTILIEGDTIKAVAPGIQRPGPATVVDLSHAWVLPGLIDCHTHITAESENYYDDTFRKSPIDRAIYAHVFASRTLDAGFTSCR